IEAKSNLTVPSRTSKRYLRASLVESTGVPAPEPSRSHVPDGPVRTPALGSRMRQSPGLRAPCGGLLTSPQVPDGALRVHHGSRGRGVIARLHAAIESAFRPSLRCRVGL